MFEFTCKSFYNYFESVNICCLDINPFNMKYISEEIRMIYIDTQSKVIINDLANYIKNDFDILSVQRNLKILGIFVRLYKRDNKNHYLKFLPYTWTLIEKRLQNPVLKNLKLLFYKHLSIKKLKKFNKL